MKKMMNVVYEFLQKNDHATFTEVFEYVAKELHEQWVNEFGEKGFKETEDDKRAELYTLISIDGRFIRDTESKWSLVENYTYEQARRMNINISENIEKEEV